MVPHLTYVNGINGIENGEFDIVVRLLNDEVDKTGRRSQTGRLLGQRCINKATTAPFTGAGFCLRVVSVTVASYFTKCDNAFNRIFNNSSNQWFCSQPFNIHSHSLRITKNAKEFFPHVVSDSAAKKVRISRLWDDQICGRWCVLQRRA